MKNKDLIKMLKNYNENDEVKIFVKDGFDSGNELDITLVTRLDGVLRLQGDVRDLKREQ